jgi:hypothetical protein
MLVQHKKLKTKVGNSKIGKDLFSMEFLTESVKVSPHATK